MASHRHIRPVVFEEAIGRFRVVTDTESMGRALLEHCKGNDPVFIAAAKALLEFQTGKGDAEAVRTACISALSSAGVPVKAAGLSRWVR